MSDVPPADGPTPVFRHAVPVALVTGGAIRVGAALVRDLVARGFRVWIHYRRSAGPAQTLATELGEAALGPLGADLADESARASLVARVLDPQGPAGGRLDLLVNSAASFESAPFAERSDADLRRVLETNLVAPISLCRAFAPALRATHGHIVNIVDLGAFHPWPNYLDHCVAKSGLAMATRALALELAPEVRANAIAPGTVAWPPDAEHAEGSPGRAEILAKIPRGEIGTPQDVAATIGWFLDASHVNGQVVAVDGGRLANFGR